MEDIEIIKYMDKKFDQFLISQRSWKRWVASFMLAIGVAFITTGFINSKIIGGLQVSTEYIQKEYVPGDLLWVVMNSYDYQDEYFLSLLSGDKEGAEEKFKEFTQFRKDMYKLHFKTRGSPSPAEGRNPKSSNK